MSKLNKSNENFNFHKSLMLYLVRWKRLDIEMKREMINVPKHCFDLEFRTSTKLNAFIYH